MASGISTHYWKSFTCSKTKQCLTCSLNSPTTLARLDQQIQDIWMMFTICMITYLGEYRSVFMLKKYILNINMRFEYCWYFLICAHTDQFLWSYAVIQQYYLCLILSNWDVHIPAILFSVCQCNDIFILIVYNGDLFHNKLILDFNLELFFSTNIICIRKISNSLNFNLKWINIY